MGVHPGSFAQRVRKRLKRREIHLALLRVAKSESNETPAERFRT